MSIEEQNRAFIKARILQNHSNVKQQTRNNINEELVASVREHRRVNGVVSKIRLLRQLVETRKWTRTVIA